MGSIVAFLIDIHEISKPYLRTGHYPTGVLDFSVLKNDMEMLLRVKWICAQGKGVSKMPVFLQFIIRRMLLIPVSLFIITLVLYGGVMLTPPEARATIYMQDTNRQLTEEQTQRMLAVIVRNHHLEDPLPIQYAYWIKNLIAGSWGYSPSLGEDVLPALLSRTPATAELTLFSLILFVPLGLLIGVISGWRQNGWFDTGFRGMAFLGTSIPPFILALIFLAVFYVRLGWFAPTRLSYQTRFEIREETYKKPTGFITIDALVNGRYDIFGEALRHLAMPALTLSLFHWATLGRLIRSTIIETREKEYITSARARGFVERRVLWRHAFRNALAPALTSMGLSAAALLTGVYVVEIIFVINGVSEVITNAMGGIPDAPAALGFAVYSVVIVLVLMFILDVLQAILDPRVRSELLR
jgi:ABC-type dipeptide/oligopeptide/nickel transport system permease component